jgi:hypothetical protein
MKSVSADKYFVIILNYKDPLEEEFLISKFLNFNPLGFKSFENKLKPFTSEDVHHEEHHHGPDEECKCR